MLFLLGVPVEAGLVEEVEEPLPPVSPVFVAEVGVVLPVVFALASAGKERINIDMNIKTNILSINWCCYILSRYTLSQRVVYG